MTSAVYQADMQTLMPTMLRIKLDRNGSSSPARLKKSTDGQ